MNNTLSSDITQGAAERVGNQDFLVAAAGRPGASLWVASFATNPGDARGEWAGHRYAAGKPLALPADHNTYFSTAEFRTGAARRKTDFLRLHTLVADDANPAACATDKPPSYVIRTSAGKCQVGYFLHDTAETRDMQAVDRAIGAMVAKGLVKADRSGNNCIRYARLPVGRNTKYAEMPAHVVEEWHPDRRYTLAEALEGFGVSTQAMEASTAAGAPADAGEWVDDAPGWRRLDVSAAIAAIVDGTVLNASLLGLSAHYAHKGLDAASIVRMLREFMDRSAAKSAVDRATRWQVRYDGIPAMVKTGVAKYGNSYGTKEDHTDLGNVNLLARKMNGDLRYVSELKTWIRWTGALWATDPTGAEALKALGVLGEHYSQEAARLKAQLPGMDPAAAKMHRKIIDVVEAWEKQCRSRRGLDNVLALASRHPMFAISVSELDTKPELLGVANGVVDLRTSELRADARDDLITRRSPYAYRPAALAPRWRKFIDEVTGRTIAAEFHAETGEVLPSSVGRYRPRPAYAAYMQAAIGYTATGLTREHKMFVPHGETGSNGKNVVFDTVHRVLGTYSKSIRPELLMVNRQRQGDANSATPATAALAGVRFAMASEPRAGAVFDNATVKALTGERHLNTRELFKGDSAVSVRFHIWLLCNAKPPVDHLEQAVVSRILMLPFDRQWNRPGVPDRDPALPDGDKHLADTLEMESEGILAWIVEGARRYLAEGLEPCQEVVDATRVYFKGQDPVGKWLEEQETCSPAIGEQARALFDAFQTWRIGRESAGTLEGGVSPVTQTAFSLALGRHGVQKTKAGVVRYGVALRRESAESAVSAEFSVIPPEEQFADLA